MRTDAIRPVAATARIDPQVFQSTQAALWCSRTLRNVLDDLAAGADRLIQCAPSRLRSKRIRLRELPGYPPTRWTPKEGAPFEEQLSHWRDGLFVHGTWFFALWKSVDSPLKDAGAANVAIASQYLSRVQTAPKIAPDIYGQAMEAKTFASIARSCWDAVNRATKVFLTADGWMQLEDLTDTGRNVGDLADLYVGFADTIDAEIVPQVVEDAKRLLKTINRFREPRELLDRLESEVSRDHDELLAALHHQREADTPVTMAETLGTQQREHPDDDPPAISLVPLDGLQWKGKTYTGLTPHQYHMLKAILADRHYVVGQEQIATAFGDHAAYRTPGADKQIFKRLNKWFEKHGLPLKAEFREQLHSAKLIIGD